MSSIPSIQVKPDRVKNILGGHPWVFSGALALKPTIPDGSLVRIVSGRQFVGMGYYNSRTDIAIRILTLRDEAIDLKFFTDRFRLLKQRKEEWLP